MIISALLLGLTMTAATASDDIHCTHQASGVANVLSFFTQYTPYASFPREFDFNAGMEDIALRPNVVSPPITYQLEYVEEANQATLVNLNLVPLHLCRFANSQIDYSACYTLPSGLNALNTSQALQAIRNHVQSSPRIDMSQQTPYMGYSMSLYTWPIAQGQNVAYQEVKFPSLVADASRVYSCAGESPAVSQSQEGKMPAVGSDGIQMPMIHDDVSEQ